MFKLGCNCARTLPTPTRFVSRRCPLGIARVDGVLFCAVARFSRTPCRRFAQSQTQLQTDGSEPKKAKKGSNDALIRFLIESFKLERETTAERLLPFKEYTFRRAIQSIQQLREPIQSSKQAREVGGIGGGIARRIDEYLLSSANDSDGAESSGTALKVKPEVIDEAKRSLTIKRFTRIHGVGETRASKLYDAGCRTFDDIRRLDLLKTLNRPTQVAYEYLEHLDNSITREHAEAVKAAMEENLDSDFEVHLVGAYRRGQTDFPLIEFLLFHPDCVHVPTPSSSTSPSSSKSSNKGKARQREPSPSCSETKSTPTRRNGRGRPARVATSAQERQDTFLADKVVRQLESSRLIQATMSETSRKWYGVVRIPSKDREAIYRRMEIHLMPTRSKGASLLTLTGDKQFFTYVGSVASKMGYHLNEYGLWCWRSKKILSDAESPSPADALVAQEQPNGGDPSTDGDMLVPEDKEGYWELIAGETEEEIFEELGLEFVVPEKRNFSFIASKERKVGKRS